MYKIFNNIKEGQQVTLICFNSFGFITSVQTTFISAKAKPHYQNCPNNMYGVAVVHKPRKKEKEVTHNFNFNSPVIVFEGWLDIDMESLTYDQISESTKITKYPCFSHEGMSYVLSCINKTPFIKYNI